VNNKFSLGGAFGLSDNEAFIVSGSEDGNIIFWDVKTKHVIQRLNGHEGVVCWVDYCPMTGKIASGGLDGTVRIWVDERDGGRVNGTNGILPDGDERMNEDMVDIKDERDIGSGDDTPREGSHVNPGRSPGIGDIEDDIRGEDR